MGELFLKIALTGCITIFVLVQVIKRGGDYKDRPYDTFLIIALITSVAITVVAGIVSIWI